MMRRLVFVLGAFGLATPAGAQTATPTPVPATQGLGGPAIPGVCLLSRQAVLANAKLAKAATARLQVLTAEAQQEIDAERKPVDADIQAFDAEQAKLTADQRKARQEALQARLRPIEAKTRLRAAEIDATRAKAVEKISAELQPVVTDVYTRQKCGLLLDRSSVIGGNMVNDLTQAVTQALDTKISTITFNREIVSPAATR